MSHDFEAAITIVFLQPPDVPDGHNDAGPCTVAGGGVGSSGLPRVGNDSISDGMTESSFYRVGRKAGVSFRRAKWMWASVAGSEGDAIRAEYGVGRDMAAVVREQTRCGQDEEAQAWLADLQRQLAAGVRNRLHRFEVTLVGDDQPTAFALPGGFIFVAEPLVDLCERDRDELAFVLGHEMSHVIRRHAIDRLISQKVLSAASLVSPGRGVLAPWIRRVGLRWLEQAYSQEQEFEADELGGLLMRAAGLDLSAAVRALDRFRRLASSVDRPGFGTYLSTHPPVQERIRRLQERFELGA